MRVKKYRAESLPEAMAQVKADLGGDALILSTEKQKAGGVLGLFRKEVFEVTAAIDREGMATPPSDLAQRRDKWQAALNEHLRASSEPAAPETALTRAPHGEAAPTGAALTETAQTETARTETAATSNSVAAEEAPPYHGNLSRDGSLPSPGHGKKGRIEGEDCRDELSEIREMLGTIMRRVNTPAEVCEFPASLQNLYTRLTAIGATEDVARDSVLGVQQLIKGEGMSEVDPTVREIFINYLGVRFPPPVRVEETAAKGRVIAFVGPTGVGKTTTIAKLAADHSLLKAQSVALLTADTYRVAAVQQLRTYADIIGLPLEAVFTPQELKDALYYQLRNDLIFLDTAGRNHRDKVKMAELRAFLEAAQPDTTFLVIGANTRYEDATEILKCYEPIGFDALIMSKLDETDSHGGVLNLLAESGKPVSYLTTGQEVPDDFEVATWEAIADLLLGDGLK